MAKMTLSEITEILTARKAEGLIWNPEFVDMKDRLGRLIWNEDNRSNLLRDALQVVSNHGIKFTFCYLSNSHDILSTAKKLRTYFAKIDDKTALDAFLAFWGPYIAASELIAELKPMVVKGRKPNPEAEARKERSLEGTGTCGCCNRNIKLVNGARIWDHGFAIVNRGYGFNAGYKTGKSCFGTDYAPIEVSSDVWRDMLAAWKTRVANLPEVIARTEKRLAEMPKPTYAVRFQATKEEKEYAKVYQGVEQSLRELRWELTHLSESAIPELTEKFNNWAPRPLPGTRR